MLPFKTAQQDADEYSLEADNKADVTFLLLLLYTERLDSRITLIMVKDLFK